MKIRVGYELIYDFPKPAPMIMVLGTHFTRAPDVIRPDHLTTSPSVPISPYRDMFGNWCSRIVAPAGRIRLSADGVVHDTGLPDVAAPSAPQHAVEDLPAETLTFLLGSRYCETDRLSEVAWRLFEGLPPGWARVQAICDFVHRHIATSPHRLRLRELIEIIRTNKDRVPLRDIVATDAGREFNVGSLVPTQKGRKLVEQEIFAEAAERVRVFGIELLDIRFKRINYNESVRPKIYDRMISERRQIAERFLSEGNGEAARIRGNRVRDLNNIRSSLKPTGRSRRSAAWRTRKPPKFTRKLTIRALNRWRSTCSPINPSSPKTRPLSFPRTVTSSSF